MKKCFIVVSVLTLFVASGLLFAGGAGESEKGAKVKNEKLIAMIIPIPKGDPFISLCINGMNKLGKEVGVRTKVIEALDKSEYSEQIRAMAEIGANPIYTLWDDLAAEVFKIAPDFPNTKFIVVDCYVSDPACPNVKSIVVEPLQASFIAGFVAAKTTKTKKVGWLGSIDLPVINKFKNGFLQGVHYGDPSVAVEAFYIGDANDPNKGNELAKQVIGKGTDVLMHSANKAGLGVIRACQEMGIKAIGVDSWQGEIDEKTVFWSALKDITNACYLSGKSVFDGTFKSGMQLYSSESGINMYDQRDFDKLSPQLKKDVLALVEKLKSGVVKIIE